MSIGDHRLLEPHHRHQHRLPVLSVVFLFLPIDDSLLLFVELACFSDLLLDQIVIDTLLDEVRLVSVIFVTKAHDFLHFLIAPVVVRSGNQRRLAVIHGETLVHVSALSYLLLVVFVFIFILVTSERADSWRPEEDSQDVLVATPALSLLIGDDLPLGHARQHMLHAQVPLDDELT